MSAVPHRVGLNADHSSLLSSDLMMRNCMQTLALYLKILLKCSDEKQDEFKCDMQVFFIQVVNYVKFIQLFILKLQ